VGGTAAAVSLQQCPEFVDDEADPAGDDGRRAIIRRALDLIRGDFAEPTWQAFWRIVVEGRPAIEVAEELGMNASAVRQAKYRVMCRLREECDGCDP
jgi:RNA polymerase sigma-70 factor (ECF subfamily)